MTVRTKTGWLLVARVGVLEKQPGHGLADRHFHVQVAEGVTTARAVRTLAARLGVEMPVCEAVARLLFENADPRAAVSELMARAPRDE